MKIEKEGIHTYLIDDYVENAYFISMEYPLMKNNTISSLLGIEVREQDGEPSVYYDVTGKESLEQIGKKKQFGYEEICGLLEGFLSLFQELDDYMLSLKQVCFDRESIFMDYRNKVYWVYGPKIQKDVQSSIEEIFLWLLSLVNPEDPLALGLAHRIYSVSKQGGITKEFVERCLKEKSAGIAEPVQKQEVLFDKENEEERRKIMKEATVSQNISLKEPLKEKKEEDKKEKNAFLIFVLKMVLLVLNLILLGYWIYFIHRYGMHRLIFGLLAATLLILSLVSGSLLRDFLKKRVKKEKNVITDPFASEELRGSNLSTKSIFEELDEYWEKGQETLIESDNIYQTDPYLYNINTCKMEPMKAFPFYIGSEEGLNQLSLSHKTVSRQHAVIVKKQDGQLYVEDLESANGTWINGNQIFPGNSVSIRNGDRIAFGQESFQYCLE